MARPPVQSPVHATCNASSSPSSSKVQNSPSAQSKVHHTPLLRVNLPGAPLRRCLQMVPVRYESLFRRRRRRLRDRYAAGALQV